MLFIDQLHRAIELESFPPKRIISLVPSQTELLFELGLDKEVVGITKFCVHPNNWFRSKKRVGGTKQLNLPAIKELKPDLIIANKEENLQEQVEQLQKEFPVWISNIKNLSEACEMIESVGALVGNAANANKLVDEINLEFKRLNDFIENRDRIRAAYLIWNNPFMTVGGDTFISDLMNRAGFNNIFRDKKRYPVISIEELNSFNCELLLLSSEPFPFKQIHADEMQKQLPNTTVLLVDGEMFSWYGSRLKLAASYFSQIRELVFNS